MVRRYLVPSYVPKVTPRTITQGYLFRDSNCSVRTVEPGHAAYLIIKTCEDGFEFNISDNYLQALELLKKATHIVTKKRYEDIIGGCPCDVDVFMGDNAGLIIAQFGGPVLRTFPVLQVPGDWVEITESMNKWSSLALAVYPYNKRHEADR